MILPFALPIGYGGEWQVQKIPNTSIFLFTPRVGGDSYLVNMENVDPPRLASSQEKESAKTVTLWPSRPFEVSEKIRLSGRAVQSEDTLFLFKGSAAGNFYLSRDGRYAVVESVKRRGVFLSGPEFGNGRETAFIEFYHAKSGGKSVGSLTFETDDTLMPVFIRFPRWLDDEYFMVPVRLDQSAALVCKFPKAG